MPAECVSEGEPDGMDGAWVKRCFARNCANSVGPKKLSHISSSVFNTVLVTLPRASCVFIVSPTDTAEVSRTS